MLIVPRRTGQTPAHAITDDPDMFDIVGDKNEEVQISCVFTEDIPRAEILRSMWQSAGFRVSVGGPAYDDMGLDFVPGRFTIIGVVHTSRGCPKNCPWCYVHKREGDIRELPICAGNIVQDNNLLACSRKHIERVVEMLRTQRGVRFLGGLDVDYLSDWSVDQIRSLRVADLWLAMDTSKRTKTLDAIRMLSAHGFPIRKIRVYAMVGFQINGKDVESVDDAEHRMEEIFKAGGLPFAQVYDQNKDEDGKWKKMSRKWKRPAATFAHMAGRK